MSLIFDHKMIPSIKIMVGIVMLMYFGSQLTFASEDIPFCQKHLKELKDDVSDWNKRCMISKSRELNTPECNAEKTHHQDRIRKHTRQCFYDGNYNYRF